MLTGEGNMLFTLKQDAWKLDGSIEGVAGGFFSGTDASIQLANRSIDGRSLAFMAGDMHFVGTVVGDQIELKQEFDQASTHEEVKSDHRPAIGPPPDGSDPSRSSSSRRSQAYKAVLRRVAR
jgi:beta-galactosidase